MVSVLPLSTYYKPSSRANMQMKLFYSDCGNQYFNGLAHNGGTLAFDNLRNLFLFYRRIYFNVKHHNIPIKPVIASSESLVDLRASGLSKIFTFERASTLDEAVTFAENLKKALRDENMAKKRLESNRRGYFVFLELSDAWRFELSKNLKLQQRLKELLTDSYSERLFIWLVMENTTALSENVLDAFDFQVFLGNTHRDYVRKLHPQANEYTYDENREIIGTLWDRKRSFLLPLHHLSMEKSFYKDQNEKIDEIEEEAYRLLLESLD